jgi:hypothetical protein
VQPCKDIVDLLIQGARRIKSIKLAAIAALSPPLG